MAAVHAIVQLRARQLWIQGLTLGAWRLRTHFWSYVHSCNSMHISARAWLWVGYVVWERLYFLSCRVLN